MALSLRYGVFKNYVPSGCSLMKDYPTLAGSLCCAEAGSVAFPVVAKVASASASPGALATLASALAGASAWGVAFGLAVEAAVAAVAEMAGAVAGLGAAALGCRLEPGRFKVSISLLRVKTAFSNWLVNCMAWCGQVRTQSSQNMHRPKS